MSKKKKKEAIEVLKAKYHSIGYEKGYEHGWEAGSVKGYIIGWNKSYIECNKEEAGKNI